MTIKPNSLRSMTGYGRDVYDTSNGSVTVEIRSLNHRFLDLSFKAPREYLYLDPGIRQMVRKKLSRGKVEIFVSIKGGLSGLTVDIERAKEIARFLADVAEIVDDRVGLEHLLAFGDIIRPGDDGDRESTAEAIENAARGALDQLVSHREEEGKALVEDLEPRISLMREIMDRINPLARSVPERSRRQITEFMEGIELNGRIDPQRLEAEVAILAQRVDVSEELTRLSTHLDAMTDTLRAGGAVGRRLDFIIQEIQREINTIGSKAGIMGVSSLIVDFKSELEKIREQIQNIE
ncbi:MAG: YicC family protein [Deltaproteobacteria bacterium]|nr:YicC family protein [Deltaproteobacteria bacterium]